MNDDAVERCISKIRDRAAEIDGDLDPDIANAPRVKLVVVGTWRRWLLASPKHKHEHGC